VVESGAAAIAATPAMAEFRPIMRRGDAAFFKNHRQAAASPGRWQFPTAVIDANGGNQGRPVDLFADNRNASR
jgi:hypothetical protein